MNFTKKWFCLQAGLLIATWAFSTNASAIVKGKLAYEANCQACHALDKFSTGPSLVYIRDNYPRENLTAFLSWVKSPGKKNPDTIQMPPMGHLDAKVITQIHDYILTVSQHLKEKKNKPKFPPFKRPAREFPFVTRGILPFTNPASIVVGLTPKLAIVWDSYVGKMRYAYPTFSPFHGEKKREENAKDILYIENDDTGFSFTQSKPISFKGYALKDGYPEFIYKTGTITVTEKITLGSKPKSFKRYFTVTGLPRQNKPISLNLAHKTKGDIPISITSSRGHLMNNVLHLTTAEASQFNVEVVLP